jgi:cephalosporin hydroxylase
MKITVEGEGIHRQVDLYSREGLELVSELWVKASCEHRIMYEPVWMGIPIIQYPGDMVMMQELIWKVRPDVIVETGVAHGGSAVFYASILELLGRGRVIAIDVEIRQYNKVAILGHPMSKRIRLIEGGSTDNDTVEQVRGLIGEGERTLFVFDSNHSYEHTLSEMERYSPMVSRDGYMVMMDGAQAFVGDIPSGKKEWREDNPLGAIREFLKRHPDWECDPYYNRLLVTSNPMGFLRRADRVPAGRS